MSGELTYNLNYFKSDNSTPASGSYTPTDSLDRPIAFFRDKIMSYLLESNPSCDYDFEFLGGNLRDAETQLGSTNILGRSSKY